MSGSKLVRWFASLAIVVGASSALAGPKGEITVRQLGDAKITIDGDIKDWPLEKFKAVAQQPLFPNGQNAQSTSAKGDHLVFDKRRIGLFNGTTDEAFNANDSDFGVTTYFAYDLKYLYILAVYIDDTIRDNRDTSPFGTGGFFNDGFEFFLDTKGDSTDCIADDAFPAIDQVEPNIDDFQVTVALNSKFKPEGSPANVLGARQTIERAGNPLLYQAEGGEKGGPGGIYRDALDAIGGPDIAARRYDDLRAAGAKNPELAAKPNVKFTGYAIEMRIPLRGRIPNMTTDHPMGFEIFWRDVDKIAADPEGKDVGAGGGDISWASWGQSTTVDCGNPTTSLFNTANWGQLVFDKTNPLVPIPAGKPTVLFVTSNADNAANADADLVEFMQDNGYGIVPFTANGSTPEGLRDAAKGKSVVFISETIGSTTVLDPAGSATGIFSLKDTDVPVVSFEAYMFDNADWVKRTEDGSNDFMNWGNTGRSEVEPLGLGKSTDSLYIRKSDHPIAKGLSGKVQVYKQPYSLNFGIPSADADVVASVNADGTYPTLFVYDKGDKLADGSVAPNKRIALFLGQAANPTANFAPDINNLTDAGKTLLLNTLAFAAGAVLQPADTATGLLGYWRMDQASGTAVPDSSGKGNNGTIVNNAAGAWINDAERGAVYKATGTNVINFGVIVPAMTTANDFTWSLWLKSDETGTASAANNNIVFGNRYNTTGADFNPREFIKFTPSNFEWHFNAAGQNIDYTDFVVGVWIHHAVVKQGTKLTYYRDGVESKVGTITGGPKNPQPLYLGGQGTQERWRGAADEVAIYARALTPADVKQAFDLGKAGKPLVDKPNIASVSVDGGNLTLTWTGGTGPFKVQRRDDIATGTWADVATRNDRTASVPRTGNAGFFRVVGQ
jgi:hypothetical protein